jgi:hypothetical protein
MHTEESLLEALLSKEIDGHDLGSMMEKGEISKQLRRKVSKKYAVSSKTAAELTERQKQRREAKEKKNLPKPTREDQINKHRVDPNKERDEALAKGSTCLGCRKSGHILKNCPDAIEDNGICFNCGSTDHTLKNCTAKRTGTLKFATCFICKSTGHIAKYCTENANGLYPKGGCCHICLQKSHLAKDCPERTEEERDRHKRARQETEDAELGPRIGFVASETTRGDDLDDYEAGAEANNNNDDVSDSEPFQKKQKKKRR